MFWWIDTNWAARAHHGSIVVGAKSARVFAVD
jgi:hypothetical protein